MDEIFLQEFLKTGLFDIGDSDDRLKWLQKSIAELQKKFEKDYSLLPKYSLVAIDPNISDEEPILSETEIIVTKHWKALRAKYSEVPRNILRGVILNALNNIGKADPLAARIIYLTASNYYPYAKLNTEKNLVEKMLIELGESAEQSAIEEWSFVENPPTLKSRTIKFNNLKFGQATLSANQLQPKLLTAVQNDPATNQGSQNSGNGPWGAHFANVASEGIATAFNSAMKGFSSFISPDSIEAPINKFFANFKTALDSNLKTVFSSVSAVERRSNLLWWKETLYSTSLKCSYRGLDSNLLAIVMSMDLNNQVPKITPTSVDFLLKDTLFLVSDNEDKLVTFEDILKAFSKKPAKEILRKYFVEYDQEGSRISITDFIALLVNDSSGLAEFTKRTGISEKKEIRLGDFAVSIFHDLLVQRLVEK